MALVNGTFDVSVPKNATRGGWTTSRIDILGGWSGGGNPGQFFILNNNGRGPAAPTIAQVVTGFAPGSMYRIEGDYRVVHLGQGTKDFGVLVDSAPILELFPPSLDARAWSPFSVDFTATSESHTIAFAGERFFDTDFGVDNLTVAEVPEPATLGLLVIGGLTLLRHKRHR